MWLDGCMLHNDRRHLAQRADAAQASGRRTRRRVTESSPILLSLVAAVSTLALTCQSASAGQQTLKSRVFTAELPAMTSWLDLEGTAESVGSHKSPLRALTSAAGTLANELRRFQRQLVSNSWPQSSSAVAQTMAAATSPSIFGAKALAKATNIIQAATLLTAMNRNESPFFYAMATFNGELKVPSVDALHAVLSCQADVSTVSIALEAFRYTNKSVVPTEALLLGTADGGPYIQDWPHNPPYYAITLVNGKQLLAAPSTSRAAPATLHACNGAFV